MNCCRQRHRWPQSDCHRKPQMNPKIHKPTKYASRLSRARYGHYKSMVSKSESLVWLIQASQVWDQTFVVFVKLITYIIVCVILRDILIHQSKMVVYQFHLYFQLFFLGFVVWHHVLNKLKQMNITRDFLCCPPMMQRDRGSSYTVYTSRGDRARDVC